MKRSPSFPMTIPTTDDLDSTSVAHEYSFVAPPFSDAVSDFSPSVVNGCSYGCLLPGSNETSSSMTTSPDSASLTVSEMVTDWFERLLILSFGGGCSCSSRMLHPANASTPPLETAASTFRRWRSAGAIVTASKEEGTKCLWAVHSHSGVDSTAATGVRKLRHRRESDRSRSGQRTT